MDISIPYAYRIKKSVDIFKEFLEPSVILTYNFFKKQEIVGILHEIIIIEALKNINDAKEAGIEPDAKDKGILSGDTIHTYHELRNKFRKANHKQTSGDPFDQNLKVLIKWDSDYYYLKFLVNGKISDDLLSILEDNFDFLEDYHYNSQNLPSVGLEEYMYRGEVWKTIVGSDHTFINFLQFDILSPERIEEWIMEPIFNLPQGNDWLYKFPSNPSDLVKDFDVI